MSEIALYYFSMKQTRALKAGDTIGIAAPSSPFDRGKFMKGVHVLERIGFKVHYRHDIFDQNRYLAGTDARRAEEFTELMRRRDISAIMFARGGYGSQRIIPLLDAKILAEYSKPVIGFSDITALLVFLRQASAIPTFYGPVLTQLGSSKGTLTSETFLRALSTGGPLGQVPVGQAHTIIPGHAAGTLVGGCLSLINSSMGTPYQLNTKDAILFIEEVNEKVYAMDRMLTQLKNSGMLDETKGIVFGALLPPPDEPYDVEMMIRDVLSGYKGPVVCGFPAGHTDDFVTLPLGVSVELNATPGGLPMFDYKTGLLT